MYLKAASMKLHEPEINPDGLEKAFKAAQELASLVRACSSSGEAQLLQYGISALWIDCVKILVRCAVLLKAQEKESSESKAPCPHQFEP